MTLMTQRWDSGYLDYTATRFPLMCSSSLRKTASFAAFPGSHRRLSPGCSIYTGPPKSCFLERRSLRMAGNILPNF
uniref:Uncharacterized protein n=1 Tax=Rhizophora mucronata TaxID=61149 RepID=A0A2P2Q9J1_RHIMU